jgi:hypothetical protein
MESGNEPYCFAPRYEAGDIRAKLNAVQQSVIQSHYCLACPTVGNRAGIDNRDLGADVELVGPRHVARALEEVAGVSAVD